MILTVHVKPSARRESIEWIDEDTLKISVTAPPEKGKANLAVIELLAEELGVAKSIIELIRGATTRIKQFKISNFQSGFEWRAGGSSMPPGENGLHRTIRQAVRNPPLSRPWWAMHSWPYSEHDG